ncbi:MAG: ArsA-related P-loop ATPase [Myxococcota bacterium]
MRLIDHRLVVVLGKGGVGRSTVSAALAVAAAEAGKKVVIAELGEAAVPPLFGMTGRSFAFRAARPGVDVWSLTVPECLEEFAARKLRLPPFARRVVRNRLVTTFVDAVPGLHDLMLLGKIENLISDPRRGDPVYDLTILDAPATGHGLTLLQAARTMTDVTRAGPFYELAKAIEVFLADRDRTATVLVTLPEALPVSETSELADQLVEEGYQPHTIIANGVQDDPLPPPPSLDAVHASLARVAHGERLSELVQAATARRQRHVDALTDLKDRVAKRGFRPPRVVPYVANRSVETMGQALYAQLREDT